MLVGHQQAPTLSPVICVNPLAFGHTSTRYLHLLLVGSEKERGVFVRCSPQVAQTKHTTHTRTQNSKAGAHSRHVKSARSNQRVSRRCWVCVESDGGGGRNMTSRSRPEGVGVLEPPPKRMAHSTEYRQDTLLKVRSPPLVFCPWYWM